MRIGSEDLEVRPEYEFHLLSDLVVTPAGEVVAIDNRAPRIAVFDAAGGWRADLGRRGRGPGEYMAPIRASSLGDTLFVSDAVLRRLSTYLLGDGFVGSVEVAERAPGLAIVALAGGYLDEVEWGQYLDPAPARGALVRRARTGAVVDTLIGSYAVPEIGWQWVDEAQTRGMMVNPRMFSLRPPWAVGAGRLAFARPGSAEIEIRQLDSGRLERLVRLPRPVRAPTPDDVEAYIDGLALTREIGPTQRAAIRQNARLVDIIPPVSKLVVDDEGRVWAAEHDPGRMQRGHVGSGWDVVDRDDAAILHVRFPDRFELVRVHSGRAVGIATGVDGVHTIEVYELGAVPAR